MGKIDIYRGEEVLAQVDCDLNTTVNEVLNGADKINGTFSSLTVVNLLRGDYIYFLDRQYSILDFVDISIDHKYTYEVELVASNYTLLDKPFINATGNIAFTKTATVTEFAQMVIDSINSINSGWTLGNIDDDGIKKELTFANENCRSAIGKLFHEFGLEAHFNGKELNLYKDYRIDDEPIEIQYGGGKGATKITKRVSGDFFTRVRGFGSTRNIPAGYRGGKERLIYDPGFASIPDADTYVEQKEIEVVFEDIYPTRIGSLDAVTANVDDILVSDTSIDFNLSDNFIDGVDASIVMDSGSWLGMEFQIIKESYNHTDKTFKIRYNKELGYTIPTPLNPIAVGDEYKFIGINLPQAYIDDAEERLAEATQSYALVKPVLDVSIGVDLDPAWVLENDLISKIRVGQPVKVVNAPTGINANMKIISVNRPYLQPEKATIVISDKVQYSEEAQVQRVIIETIKETRILKENIKEVKAFTSRRLDENQSMAFDPMGFLRKERLAALVVDAININVGSRAQLFTISNVFRLNWLGNPNAFNSTNGVLAHSSVNPGSVTSWSVTGGTIVGLDPAKPYYIYARCNRANNSGLIVLDEVQREIESDSTYYYFLIGWISSVTESGIRYPTLSYGIAELNGQFIKGVLTSDDGLSYIDLNSGDFSGKIRFLNRDQDGYIDPNDIADAAVEAKNKTDDLKAMAFEDVVEWAKMGETVVEGGFLRTNLLKADAVVALVMKAEYVEALDVNFTQGTIGGNEITSTGIVGEKFSIINGVITAEDITCVGGTFENINVNGGVFESIEVDGLTATNVEIIGSIKTAEGPTGSMFDATGMYIYNGVYGGVSFGNDGQNIITGSYLQLDVSGLTINGNAGFSGILAGRTFINGICI